MIDFNEPLPNIHEDDEIRPNPIIGDVGLRGDLDVTFANAVSNVSCKPFSTIIILLSIQVKSYF